LLLKEFTMAHEDELEDGAQAGQGGISRRKLIVTGATLAAGVAVGAAIPITASAVHDHAGSAGPVPQDPMMLHVRDANSGQLDLFVGTQRISFTDRDIAAKLIKAANSAS
jgi:hypothetical protein